MQITKLSTVMGARVEGVDCAQPLTAAAVGELQAAWRRHHVLVFPGQRLTVQQQAAFSRNFGQLFEHPITRTRPAPRSGPRSQCREISEVRRAAAPRGPAPGAESTATTQLQWEPPDAASLGWHSDVTFVPVPPAYSILYGKQPIGVGDDTQFCNLHAGYESLSHGLQRLLGTLRAVHTGVRFLYKPDGENRENRLYHAVAAAGSAGSDEERSLTELGTPMEQLHPCVRVHPETGRLALMINNNFVDRFEGWTHEESRPLLQMVVAHAAREANVYRHRWTEGDVVCWDNRAVWHCGPSDGAIPAGRVRYLLRTTVTPRGEARPYAPASGSRL
jgi:taurine dioxygenase